MQSGPRCEWFLIRSHSEEVDFAIQYTGTNLATDFPSHLTDFELATLVFKLQMRLNRLSQDHTSGLAELTPSSSAQASPSYRYELEIAQQPVRMTACIGKLSTAGKSSPPCIKLRLFTGESEVTASKNFETGNLCLSVTLEVGRQMKQKAGYFLPPTHFNEVEQPITSTASSEPKDLGGHMSELSLKSGKHSFAEKGLGDPAPSKPPTPSRSLLTSLSTESGEFCRLVDTLFFPALKLYDVGNVLGIWFVPDLRIINPGKYRLRFELVDLSGCVLVLPS
jgi:Velvet factor